MNPKFCPKCGIPLKFEDMKFCSNCRAPIGIEPNPQVNRNIKTKKKKWVTLSGVLLLIGSLIGILAFFTPTGSFNYGGLLSWDMWMFGYNIVYDYEVGTDIFWTGNSYLLGFSIMSTIFVVLGNILAILGVIMLLRKKDSAYMLAGAGAVMLIGSSLFYLISYEVYFWIFTGDTFWGFLFPAFGVYGQFIAAAFMIPAFFLARKAHQEKVYTMLNTIVEIKRLRDTLLNELEIFPKSVENKPAENKDLLEKELLSWKSKLEFMKLEKRRKAEQIICNFLTKNKGKAFTSNSLNKGCLELQQLGLEIDEIEGISKHLNFLGKIGLEVKENETFYYMHYRTL